MKSDIASMTNVIVFEPMTRVIEVMSTDTSTGHLVNMSSMQCNLCYQSNASASCRGCKFAINAMQGWLQCNDSVSSMLCCCIINATLLYYKCNGGMSSM